MKKLIESHAEIFGALIACVLAVVGCALLLMHPMWRGILAFAIIIIVTIVALVCDARAKKGL